VGRTDGGMMTTIKKGVGGLKPATQRQITNPFHLHKINYVYQNK
jgi:hypothetical protein